MKELLIREATMRLITTPKELQVSKVEMGDTVHPTTVTWVLHRSQLCDRAAKWKRVQWSDKTGIKLFDHDTVHHTAGKICSWCHLTELEQFSKEEWAKVSRCDTDKSTWRQSYDCSQRFLQWLGRLNTHFVKFIMCQKLAVAYSITWLCLVWLHTSPQHIIQLFWWREHWKSAVRHWCSLQIVALGGEGCIADSAMCQAGFVGLWPLQLYNTVWYSWVIDDGLNGGFRWQMLFALCNIAWRGFHVTKPALKSSPRNFQLHNDFSVCHVFTSKHMPIEANCAVILSEV